MHYKTISQKTYLKFSKVDGNQHIAGDYAIEKILNLIRQYRPHHILEIGLGIGSIADAILNYLQESSLNVSYYGTEENEFCLNALKFNVDNYTSIQIFGKVSDIDKNLSFDFAIVDGSDDTLKELQSLLSEHAVVFIEGHRINQVNTLKQIYPKAKHVEIISMRKPPKFGPFQQKWTGGGQLIFIDPTFWQNLNYLSEKIKSFLKRRLRKFVKHD